MAQWLDGRAVARRIRETSTRLELLLARLNVDQMNQPGAVGDFMLRKVCGWPSGR